MDNRSLQNRLSKALIPSLPASGYYVPNFITETEEAYLLQKVYFPGFDPSFLLHWQSLIYLD